MQSIKLFLVLALAAIIFSACGRSESKNQDQSDQVSQNLFADTLDISQKFIAIHLRSEEALLSASSYPDYETWSQEMKEILESWEGLEAQAATLEDLAGDYIKKKPAKLGYLYTHNALALSAQEISDIFDRAAAGKKIKTLAQHLGIDAKRAFQILQQAQAQMEANAWSEAGDTFQTLETAAVVIKDGAKVAGFVGGLAISGGTAGFAAAGVATKAAVVVGGADLVLEVTEDASKIALGNNNKVAEIVSSVRVITEPVATILAINSIPENLGSGFDKFNAVMASLEQFRVVAQEGKVIGVFLPTYEGVDKKNQASIKAVAMDEEEIDEWLDQLGLKRVDGNIQEILKKIQQKTEIVQEAQARVELATEELKEENSSIVSGESGGFRATFSSPQGNFFEDSQARMWKVDIEKPSGSPLMQMCQWTFYLNGAKYQEMLDNRGCAFTSTFIDKVGSLRAEVKVQFKQGRSVFDDDGKLKEYVYDVVEEIVLTRDFIVE